MRGVVTASRGIYSGGMMLLPEALNEVQLITLRYVLRTSGLRERNIDDVMLLLWTRPPQIQLAFYYVSCGETQERVAERLGVTQRMIGHYINGQCWDIKRYLKYSNNRY